MNRRNCVENVLAGVGVAIVLGLGGCTHEAETAGRASASGESVDASAHSPAASGPADEAKAGVLPLHDGRASLVQPIHAGVTVRGDSTSVVASYTRQRGKPFGVAYMLAPGALDGVEAVMVEMTTEPALRPQLCLTDADGFVWNAPATRDAATGALRFDVASAQADPFQNGGKVVPTKMDVSKIGMLTLLDISGFMGGSESACTWTITRMRLVRAGSVGNQGGKQSEQGGAR